MLILEYFYISPILLKHINCGLIAFPGLISHFNDESPERNAEK